MKGYCGNCKKVIDETEIHKVNGLIVCYECFDKPKPYLCQICKLSETCQNNFDYECIEASDFLFTLKLKLMCITCGVNEAINDFYKECEGCIIKHEGNINYTVKDDFLDSLTKKDNKALRG